MPLYFMVGLQKFEKNGDRISISKQPVDVPLKMNFAVAMSEDLTQEEKTGEPLKEFADDKNTEHMKEIQN